MPLGPLLDARADPQRAFTAFERQRRPRVDAIARQARRNNSGKANAGPLAAWFRDHMLRLFLPRAAAEQTRAYAHRISWEAA